MQNDLTLTWHSESDHITLSPRDGGRIVSWMRGGQEMAMAPTHYEGGLFRILFAEEQYPGSSYVVPHQVVEWRADENGFRAHLRHYWNTPAHFMREAGWPEKANELHIDGLLLDKVLTYRHEQSCLVCNYAITNLSNEIKYLTPWVHLAFEAWPRERWIAVAGERQEYNDTDIYWGSHLVPRGTHASIVQADAGHRLFAVLGTPTDAVRGLCAMLPIPGEFHQATGELRGAGLELAPRAQFRASCFLALSDDWQQITSTPPVDLYCEITSTPDRFAPALTELLQHWMLPEEERRGLMILSFLDKPPFSSHARYAAAHCFSGFHFANSAAQAKVMLYANRDLPALRAEVIGGSDRWQLQYGTLPPSHQFDIALQAHDYRPLALIAPPDLSGKETVVVELTIPNHEPVQLRIEPQATVQTPRSYQVRQSPAYMEERYRDKLGPAPDADSEAICHWQEKMRARLRQWLEFNAYGDCDLDPLLVERQEGPTCIREKWLVQTEPGIHVPGFLIRPHSSSGRMPLIYFLHGSGPGKDGFAGDELENPVRTMLGHELENLPYALAHQLKCLVYVPDGRGQGELGETDPGRWSARIKALGISNAALRLRDQIRALDWLVTRKDVDPARIGSCGCSGGGGMTYMFAAADERVAASIVSSTMAAQPIQPAPSGWFHRMLLDNNSRIEPYGIEPVSGAPMGMLIAPRPMWIVDGLDDLGVPAEERDEWRQSMQQGRDAIRRIYERLDAEDSLLDTWEEGGHCAGMTHERVIEWFRRWF